MKVLHSIPDAEEEYEAALAVSRDPTAFRKDVNDALDAILKGIIVHRKVGRGITRECFLSRLPYSIVYQDEADSITVVAFAHKSRRRGYWKTRLKKS
jgi:hypothetical protein